MVNGKEQEVESNKPFVIIDEQIVYDFDPKDYKPELIIKPTSRTFIPACDRQQVLHGNRLHEYFTSIA